MKRMIFAITALLLLLALALSPSNPTLFAAATQQNATPTPATEAEPTAIPATEAEAESEATHAEKGVAEPTIADLLTRLESLEATVVELHAANISVHAAAYTQANTANTAVYFLDSAGLHGLDVRLNEEGIIEPSDAGRVAQIARLLTTVEWPEGLAEDAAALYETLTALSAALGEDDVKTAASLATQVHEEQHDFSHHVQAWLAGAVSYDQANAVNTALYLLDGAGLHGVDVQLNETGEILPGDSGQVGRVARLLTEVAWPKGLIVEATALHQTLASLSAALGENDIAAAAPLATQAHEEQHDFSHEAQEWLSAQGM